MPALPAAPSRPLLLAVYLHPFEVCLGVILVLIGLRNLGVGVEPPPTLEAAAGSLASIAWLIGNLLGGSMVLAGVLWHRRAVLRAIEKAGLYLVASTTAAYAVAVAFEVGTNALYATAELLALAAACVIRAWAIHKTEVTVLEQLSAVNACTAALHPVELVHPRRRATDR